MAYAALVSLQRTTDLFLNQYKYSIYDDQREQITSILKYVLFLISFFENSSQELNLLEGKIRDLANEAEDLIDCFTWSPSRIDWRSVWPELERELKQATEEICSMSGDLLHDQPAAVSSSKVATLSKIDVVIGLEDDLKEIKGRLCSESTKLEVIPIVGMGGIGKTTLALKAYNDPLTIEYFDIRAWVTVSQGYSVHEILLSLLVSMNLLEKNEFVAEEKLYKALKGRRYLIVMDDIWSTNVWDDLKNIFPDDKNGSRIMITTRLSDVATNASSSRHHDMKFMDGNHSWNLLKQKVLIDGQDCPPELEDIGKHIALGCGGLPLAVVLVAGMLSTVVKTRASWEKIAKNVNAVIDGQIDKILSLSYRLLPHHLRPCFLFMAGFPEDHTIYVSRLIKLWVAEGFLKHQNEHKSMEEEAEEHLEDLVKRSLVLITSRKSNGRIKSCRLHDLVRDMCIRKAQEEKFLRTNKYIDPERRINEHRISISHCRLNEIWGPTIRTILCFQPYVDSSLLNFVVNFTLLRVLDITHDNFVWLPTELYGLIHLRYLAVGLAIDIPAGISKLVNLQTLIIRPRREWDYESISAYVPLEIWRMSHLRHLVLTNFMLVYPSDGPPPLENLQTLSFTSFFMWSKSVLRLIRNLKKLAIICSGAAVHGPHDLTNLHQLEKLKISRKGSWGVFKLAFPSTLRKLTLVGGRLPWKDMTIVGSLPNLEVLKLREFACDGKTWETTDGGFPQLKFLQVQNSKLQCWITESDHFPTLKWLILHDCPCLVCIPDEFGSIQTLELIEVDEENQSLVESAKQIQEEQLSYGNDTLQVHCIHSMKDLKNLAFTENLEPQSDNSRRCSSAPTSQGRRKQVIAAASILSIALLLFHIYISDDCKFRQLNS